MPEVMLVIAGSLEEFRRWQEVNRGWGGRYISSPESVQGHRKGTLYCYTGTWRRRDDLGEIQDALHGGGCVFWRDYTHA